MLRVALTFIAVSAQKYFVRITTRPNSNPQPSDHDTKWTKINYGLTAVLRVL